MRFIGVIKIQKKSSWLKHCLNQMLWQKIGKKIKYMLVNNKSVAILHYYLLHDIIVLLCEQKKRSKISKNCDRI